MGLYKRTKKLDILGETVEISELGVDFILALERGEIEGNAIEAVRFSGVDPDALSYEGFMALKAEVEAFNKDLFETLSKPPPNQAKKNS